MCSRLIPPPPSSPWYHKLPVKDRACSLHLYVPRGKLRNADQRYHYRVQTVLFVPNFYLAAQNPSLYDAAFVKGPTRASGPSSDAGRSS